MADGSLASDELLQHLFKGFPDGCNALNVLRNGALEIGCSAKWAVEWEQNAKPLISEVRFIIFKSKPS